MKFFFVLGVVIIGATLSAMENEVPITRDNLMQKACSLPEDLDQAVSNWLWEQQDMINTLMDPPKDYTLANRRAKKEAICTILNTKQNEFVQLYNEEDSQESDSQVVTLNHTIRPNNEDRFVVQIGNFNRLLAHLVYITGQGDMTKENIDPVKIDPNKLKQAPDTYMHAGRLATYLLCKENVSQGKIHLPKTYIKKLPWLNKEDNCLSDRSSVIVQEYIPNFCSLKRLSKDNQVAFINEKLNDSELLNELYNLITAGAWDGCGSLGTAQDNNFYLCDFEPTIFNHPEDFMFQEERGRRQYLSGVYDGIIRAQMLLNKGNGKAAKIWKSIVNNDTVPQEKFKSNNIVPSIKLEYEENTSCGKMDLLKAIYGEKIPGWLEFIGQ